MATSGLCAAALHAALEIPAVCPQCVLFGTYAHFGICWLLVLEIFVGIVQCALGRVAMLPSSRQPGGGRAH